MCGLVLALADLARDCGFLHDVQALCGGAVGVLAGEFGGLGAS